MRHDTHGAHVFLAGDHAYKLKRAVTLPFLDFSTLALRRAACENELRLNRRTAPDYYLGVVPVTRQRDGGLRLGGAGEVVDWTVHMRRFPDAALLDVVAREGRFDDGLARQLADVVAAFHGDAEVFTDRGGYDEMARVADINAGMIRGYVPQVFAASEAEAQIAAVATALSRQRPLLARRQAAGFVRHCHGDLHLRNIFLDGSGPHLFDAIEFDDRMARTDVLYDLAFLLMDLWHRELRKTANLVLGRYLARTNDLDGLAAMPLFLSLRAQIRAHVSATMAKSAGDPVALRAEAVQYLRLAGDVLRPRPARLVGVGGFSGSGKSTFAAALAPWLGPPPGAVCLRSDEIRKGLFGVTPEQALPAAAYDPAVSAEVYAELRQRAARVGAAGYAAIVDAVNDRAEDRRALAATAADAGLPFVGFWLDAAPAVLAARVRARRADASDADVAVLQAQLERGAGDVGWHRLDAAQSVPDMVGQARDILAADGPGPPGGAD